MAEVPEYLRENAYAYDTTGGHDPYVTCIRTDQPSYQNICTVTEANSQSRLASGAKPKAKPQSGFKAITQRATSKLQNPFTVRTTDSHGITFSIEDKLVIIFRHTNKYIVCRIRDNTVTVLTDPLFKTKNPTIIYDGDEKGDILNNVKMILMFAVAKTAHKSSEIHFKSLDLILVLAKSRVVYLGISPSGQIGFFPREKVVFITEPRKCIHPGLIIKVQAITDMIFGSVTICRGKLYFICKGNDDPFDWRLPSSHLRIPLESFREHNVKGIEPLPELQPQRHDTYGYCGIELLPALSPQREDSYGYCDTTISTNRRLPLPRRPAPPPPLPPRNPPSQSERTPYQNTGVICDGDEAEESSNFSDEESVDGGELYHDSDGRENTEESCGNSKEDSADIYYNCYRPAQERSNFNNNESAYDEGMFCDARSERMTKPEDPPVPAPRFQSHASSTSSDSQTGIEASILFETISDDDERLYPACTQSEDVKKEQNKLNEREDLLRKLLPYREVAINDKLRSIVAESVDHDVLNDLCRQLKVPQNRLRDIHDQRHNIYDKTYELLGIWQGKFERNANVGFLLDALVEVNPEDLHLILEDMLRYFEDANVGDSGLGEIPEVDKLYALPKKAKARKVQVFLNDLRCFHGEEFNDEMKQIVSQYIDRDVWHDLGESLEIPKNTRIEIERNNSDIFGKTFDLLGQWHQKFGSQATLGFLLEALVSVNPADLYLILKDLSKNLGTLLYEDVQ